MAGFREQEKIGGEKSDEKTYGNPLAKDEPQDRLHLTAVHCVQHNEGQGQKQLFENTVFKDSDKLHNMSFSPAGEKVAVRPDEGARLATAKYSAKKNRNTTPSP